MGTSADVGHRAKLAQLANAHVPQAEVIFSDGYTGVKGYPPTTSLLYGKEFFTLIAGLMHPPADPLGKPVIDPKYLDNEYNFQAMVELVKFCRRIALAEPLRGVWVDEYDPGLERVSEY